ncbi:BadF-type ATPase [Friedmanniella luteola]|uniref:BadF-type ATPase n=1 Tax=Friedmanniella luteola TaxID=546871 RepID=A0A1H1R3N5_9ACTN|nr:BadF/BadG/BcrA/BcrD ATPase family protein [Friedmanniella luteola]SDS30411.1 BadF-type ATPase [Friedmanniella luteola]
MRTYLGVDGGGTGTALCLISEDGDLLGRVEAPSCYYLGSAAGEGVGQVARVLTEAVAVLTDVTGTTAAAIGYAFVGLPAYGEVSADVPALDAAPREALGHDRYRCDNDMVCGWAGSLALADGVNVIGGTGSMTYGRRAGQGLRVGGWGEVFGDEGSGYWIGVQGLRAFSRMSDGRLPPGPLLDVLRARLGLAADLDAVDVVLNRWRGSRREVAALAPAVVEAARRGDGVAAAVLDEAGAELARLVTTTRQRLGFRAAETVPVSYSGGVFGAVEVLDAFRAHLVAAGGPVDLRAPVLPPVVGAALHAAQLAGSPLSAAALARLRRVVATTTPTPDHPTPGGLDP